MATTRVECDAVMERVKELVYTNDSVQKILTAERGKLAFQLKEANAKLQTIETEKGFSHHLVTISHCYEGQCLARHDYYGTKHRAMFTHLYTGIESSKQQLVDSTLQIKTVLAKTLDPTTRIVTILEDNAARIFCAKEAALEEAQ